MLPYRNTHHLLLGSMAVAQMQPEAERTLPSLMARGNCMGEAFILLSCGAAFITGLVIAAASLFS